MASIRERIGKNGEKTYNCLVRPKGNEAVCRSFKDRETAYIWGKYQEMILGERVAFGPRPDDMYSILDVMTAKYGEGARELRESMEYFQDILGTPLSELSYDALLDHAKLLLETPVRRGGQAKANGEQWSGTLKLPEPMTILRKYAYLASSISFLIKKGVPLQNNAIKVVAYLRELDRKVKDNRSK